MLETKCYDSDILYRSWAQVGKDENDKMKMVVDMISKEHAENQEEERYRKDKIRHKHRYICGEPPAPEDAKNAEKEPNHKEADGSENARHPSAEVKLESSGTGSGLLALVEGESAELEPVH